MCLTPSVPTTSSTTTQQEVAAPTTADASVTKSAAAQRVKQQSLAGRDVKTSARGLGDAATSQKKTLLGE